MIENSIPLPSSTTEIGDDNVDNDSRITVGKVSHKCYVTGAKNGQKVTMIILHILGPAN